MIKSSFEELDLKDDYNSRLLNKVGTCKISMPKSLVPALSLILSGFLLFTIYTTDIRYRLIDLELQIKYEISSLQNILSYDNTMFRE